MNDLLDFLTSQEIIIVYIIAAFACLICLIVYLIEKNNDRLRKKHNTKELNKLVEEIKAQLPEEEEQEMVEIPIIERVIESSENSINDLVRNEPVMVTNFDVKENEEEVIEPEKNLPVISETEEEEDELEYTTIEPDQETAKLELKKLEEELEREAALEETGNIPLTSFEEEQERTAIISMDELLAKGKELYDVNEVVEEKYEDEGNEPISIHDLERQVEKEAATYNEPFIIENVVSDDIKKEIEQKLHMDDMTTIKEESVQPVITIAQPVIAPAPVKIEEKPVEKKPEVKRFKSSPIISPIFGIEKDVSSERDLALENTANYEKLDAQMRKQNEFVMSLKDLQKNLD